MPVILRTRKVIRLKADLMRQKYYPFPAEIPAEYFILLNNFLIFITHYAADDHLICDLLPADHLLQQAFGHGPDISLLY